MDQEKAFSKTMVYGHRPRIEVTGGDPPSRDTNSRKCSVLACALPVALEWYVWSEELSKERGKHCSSMPACYKPKKIQRN